MSIPITRADIIAIGQRFPSEAIEAEIYRLLPTATADIAVLEAGGYTAEDLEALRGYGATLSAETTARRAQRAQKKNARQKETDAIRDGKRTLRSAVAMAEKAITFRVPPEGEPREVTQRITRDLVAALEPTRGRVDYDITKLRTRLGAIAALLASDAIAPSESGRAARTAMIERVTTIMETLPELNQNKKGAQEEARATTDALDETDGRAYLNLRALAKIGRAQWLLAGNPGRAAAYRLTLDDPRPKRAADPAPTPA